MAAPPCFGLQTPRGSLTPPPPNPPVRRYHRQIPLGAPLSQETLDEFFNTLNKWKQPETPAALLVGPAPAHGIPWDYRFFQPYQNRDHGEQWVQVLMFNAPCNNGVVASSLPPLHVFYHVTRPLNISGMAAGEINLQQQLGNLKIQAASLSRQTQAEFG